MRQGTRYFPEEGGGGVPGPVGAGGKPSSVQLRAEGASQATDPAGQSLSDALRITFALLKVAMVILLALYVLSGFQRVNEGEQGIRLLFGRVQTGKVDPGFQFAWPFPFGQLERVKTGANSGKILASFWPEGSKNEEAKPDELTPSATVKPNTKWGSLLTADGNIAHAQVEYVYFRANPREYAEVVPSLEEEQRLVEAAVKKGVVQAVAQVTIDDLLKQTNTVGTMAREHAQAALDAVKCGVVIDTVAFKYVIPPVAVKAEFASVQAAVSRASKAVEEARLEAQRTLNRAAGSAAPALLAAIDAYEGALESKGAGAEQALARIQALLNGEVVEHEGRAVQLAGEAAATINQAKQYRAEVSARKRAELSAFNAKLEQYKSNPSLMISREWQNAVSAFYGRDSVQITLIPVGMRSTTLLLNTDPDDVKERDRARRKQEAEDAQRKRNEELQKSRFQTDTSSTSG